MSGGLVIGPRIGPMIGPQVGVGLNTFVPSLSDPMKCPVSAAAFTALGLTAPNGIYLCQETSGNIFDKVASNDLAVNTGSPTYGNAVAGWARKGVGFADQANPNQTFLAQGGTIPVLSTTSLLAMFYVKLTATPSAEGGIVTFGAGGATPSYASTTVAPVYKSISGANNASGASNPGATLVRPVILKHNVTGSVQTLYTDQEKFSPTFGTNPTANNLELGGVTGVLFSAPFIALYGATWFGASAEMSDSTVRTLLQTLGWSPAW